MSEQQKDFKKIIFALKSEKYSPEQMGKFMRQYYQKHLSGFEVQTRADTITQTLDDPIKIFDGKVALF